MAVQKKPTIYTASDGTEFDDKTEAEQYDILISAKIEYKAARNEYKRILMESQKTKDGEPFEFHKWNPYWVVRDYIGQTPEMESVDPWFHNVEINDRCEASFLFSKCGYEDKRVNSFESVCRSYKISELYYHKENAEAALAEAIKLHIAELEERIA